MNNATHTPGPWRALLGRSMWTIIGPGFTGPADGNKKYAAVAVGEREANARLIAAAPDLLAACWAALILFEGLGGCDELGDYFAERVDDLITILSTTIAKAEGKQV